MKKTIIIISIVLVTIGLSIYLSTTRLESKKNVTVAVGDSNWGTYGQCGIENNGNLYIFTTRLCCYDNTRLGKKGNVEEGLYVTKISKNGKIQIEKLLYKFDSIKSQYIQAVSPIIDNDGNVVFSIIKTPGKYISPEPYLVKIDDECRILLEKPVPLSGGVLSIIKNDVNDYLAVYKQYEQSSGAVLSTLLKFDNSGKIIWQKHLIEENSLSNGYDILPVDENTYFLADQTWHNYDIDNNHSSYLATVDVDGNTINCIKLIKSEYFHINKIISKAGSIFIFGSVSTKKRTDAVVKKISPTGEKIWITTCKKMFNTVIEGVVEAKNGFIFLYVNSGGNSFSAVKIDFNGKIIWSKNIGEGIPFGITSIKDNKYVIMRELKGVIKMDFMTVFLTEIDENGNKIWE